MSVRGVQLVKEVLYNDIAVLLTKFKDGQNGFDYVENGVIEILTSFLINYLSQLSLMTHQLAISSNRASCNSFDFMIAMYTDNPELCGIFTRCTQKENIYIYLNHLKATPMDRDAPTIMDTHLHLNMNAPISPIVPRRQVIPDTGQIDSYLYNALYIGSRFLFFTICLDIIREIIGMLAAESRGDDDQETDMESWGLTEGGHEDADTGTEGLLLIPMLTDIIKGNTEAIQTLIIDEVNGDSLTNPSSYATINEPASHYTDIVDIFTNEYCCISPFVAAKIRNAAWYLIRSYYPVLIGSIYKFINLNKVQMGLTPYPVPVNQGVNDRRTYSFVSDTLSKDVLPVPEPGGSIFGSINSCDSISSTTNGFRRAGNLGFKVFSLDDILTAGTSYAPVFAPMLPPKELFALRLFTMNSALGRLKLVQDWCDGICVEHMKYDLTDI